MRGGERAAAQERADGTAPVDVRQSGRDRYSAPTAEKRAQKSREDVAPPEGDGREQVEVGRSETDHGNSPIGGRTKYRVDARLEEGEGVREDRGAGNDVSSHDEHRSPERSDAVRRVSQSISETRSALIDPEQVGGVPQPATPPCPVLGRRRDHQPPSGVPGGLEPAAGEIEKEIRAGGAAETLFPRLPRGLPGEEQEVAGHSSQSYDGRGPPGFPDDSRRMTLAPSRPVGRFGTKGKRGLPAPLVQDAARRRNYRLRSMNFTNSLRGRAPRTRSATSPPLNSMKVGIEVI